MKGIEMNKDQQIEKLKATIKEMEAAHEESKERLIELYNKERRKRQVEMCMYEIQKRAAAYILDSIIEGRTPDANDFLNEERMTR